jgi:hypothetical protein
VLLILFAHDITCSFFYKYYHVLLPRYPLYGDDFLIHAGSCEKSVDEMEEFEVTIVSLVKTPLISMKKNKEVIADERCCT